MRVRRILGKLRNPAAAWAYAQSAVWRNTVGRNWRIATAQARKQAGGKTLLHIGCGEIDAVGFVNVDARGYPHVDIVTSNLCRLPQIPNETADLIYMSHVLEHVGHREAPKALREMLRILKSGGVLRLSVPDFDLMLQIYEATGRNVLAIEQPLMGAQDYEFNYHKTLFNSDRLRAMLLDAGFHDVQRWDPAQVAHHGFDDWASRNVVWNRREFPISLNLEAVK